LNGDGVHLFGHRKRPSLLSGEIVICFLPYIPISYYIHIQRHLRIYIYTCMHVM
jgi:hypothetical protein